MQSIRLKTVKLSLLGGMVAVALSACAAAPGVKAGDESTGVATTTSNVGPTSSTHSSGQSSTSSMTTSETTSPATSSRFGTVPTRLDCGSTSHMTLDLIMEFVGQPSPVEAAQFFVRQSWAEQFTAPANAVWTVGESGAEAYVITDNLLLHVRQSPINQTWMVDEADLCA